MTRSYLLDTNMVSYIVSGASLRARARLQRCAARDAVFISAISEAELRFGMAKRPEHAASISAVEGFLGKAAVLPWGHEEAVAYGELRTRMQAAGTPLGALDTLIAAHALAIGAVLVTHDKGFERLNKARVGRPLLVADWATDLLDLVT